jgi:hypothetical protein
LSSRPVPAPGPPETVAAAITEAIEAALRQAG